MVGIVRQRLLPILLALLAILAWWLSLMREGPRLAQDTPPGEPDQVVEGLRITTLDEAGQPQRRLVAREARHYPGGAGSELDAPRLTLFTAEGPPWRLKSERGWVAEEAAEIRLRGEVFLDRDCTGLSAPAVAAVHAFWQAWNAEVTTAADWQDFVAHLPEIAEHTRQFRDRLAQLPDLSKTLADFCRAPV